MHRNVHPTRWLLVLTMGWSAQACLEDQQSGSDKPLQDLTEAERRALCEDLEEITRAPLRSDEGRHARCIAGPLNVAALALTDGHDAREAVASCNEEYAECLERSDEPWSYTERAECSAQHANLHDCSASVDEYTTCLTASANAFTGSYRGIQCSDVSTLPDESSPALTALTECDIILERCPEVLTGWDERAGSPISGQ